MSKKYLSLIFAAALFIGSSVTANAVPITGLFNTGVDGSGNVLPNGSLDPHYTVLENGNAPAVLLSSPHGTYIPNSASSKWVWQQSNGLPINVNRTFRLTFDLSGLDHTSANISGLWAVDNRGLDILINGNSTGNTNGGFRAYSPFSINSGFVAGINTLDFVTNDFGGLAAFRVDSIAGTANVLQPRPNDRVNEPAGLALIGLFALAGMAARRRR
ncbi:MAG: hypothetical protein CMF31_05400 [Kordiimonas sp.]|mgnify:CR=1 FL=1|nr:hypothetical protein [Kordiimonas sp.]